MTVVRPCILCLSPGTPAAPGWHACHRCADRLAGMLGDLGDRYATLQTADELIPHGSGERGSPGFGPRSPAVDALLVHSDVRTRWTSEHGHGALAVVESWARMIREETGAGAPAGRATMNRELATIRWNWDWLLGQDWLDKFAEEIRDVLRSLKHAGRLNERRFRLGPCPTEQCVAMLSVKVADEDIHCRACDTIWPRSTWHELGDPWADYAALSALLSVPVGTLGRWCHEDRWAVSGTRSRRLVARADALASYKRRRGPIPLEQAG